MNNFCLITGSATSKLIGVVAGAKVTKLAGYSSLADFVNQRCGCNWDPKTSMNRYKAFVKIFTDTRRAYNNVNGAKYLLGEDDLKKGITTIQQKLNSDCYGYNRMDALFGERQNVTPSCIMTTGAPVVLNHIDRANMILAEDGALLGTAADDYEYGVVEEGDDDEESSSDESSIAEEPLLSETSTLTVEGTPPFAPIIELAAAAQAPAPFAPPARAAAIPQAPPAPFALLAAAAAPQAPAPFAPPARAAAVPQAPPAPAAAFQAPPPVGAPTTAAAAPAAKGKKGKKAAALAIPTALVEAAIETVASVADGSAPKISLQKKKKDFSSSYADVKEKELLLLERKFEWEKSEAFVAEKENKRLHVLEEAAWRANETSAATTRTEIMARADERKTTIAALVTKGKSPAEIREYLELLDLL